MDPHSQLTDNHPCRNTEQRGKTTSNPIDPRHIVVTDDILEEQWAVRRFRKSWVS